MRNLALLLGSLVALAVAAGCTPYQPPANYYENDIHHGIPGPGVADPSAV